MRALAGLLALTLVQAAPARAEVWTSDWDDSGDLLLLMNCPRGRTGGPPPACLIFDCWWDGGIGLRVIPGTAPVPPQSGMVLSLDGAPVMQAVLSDSSNGNNAYLFGTPITRGVLEGLFARMETAATVGLAFDAAALNLPALSAMSLDGFPAAVRDFRQQCVDLGKTAPVEMAPAIAPPGVASIWHLPEGGPNPDTDPQRFVNIDAISVTDASAVAEARRLAAGAIAEADGLASRSGAGPVEVLANLIPFRDGRRMLFARLCHPTIFGITGCDTHFFRAHPGQDFILPGESWIGGGPYWLDLQASTAGWPDLVSRPHTANGAYLRSPTGP